MLGVVAVQLEVAQLGVGHQLTVVEQRGADAGAEGEDEDDPLTAPGGAEAGLGQPGGVGVVEHDDRPPGGGGEEGGGVGADPGRVHVGRAPDHALLDDAREGAGDGALGREVGGDRGDRGGHRLGGGGMGRLEPEPLLGELRGVQVDRSALDPAAADVDAEPDRHLTRVGATGPPAPRVKGRGWRSAGRRTGRRTRSPRPARRGTSSGPGAGPGRAGGSCGPAAGPSGPRRASTSNTRVSVATAATSWSRIHSIDRVDRPG